MSEGDKLNVDKIIAVLLEGKYQLLFYCDYANAFDASVLNNSYTNSYLVRGSRPGKNVQLTENEIRGLCLKSREIFLSQPILLELEAPLKICGK